MEIPGGNPVRLTEKFTFAVVMLPAESVVVSQTTATVPLPVDSGPEIGGISLPGDSVATSVGLVVGVADGADEDEELPQETANTIAALNTHRRFIAIPPR